jgi:hypothetical protein
MSQILSISHNIFLDRNQRYDLNNKKVIEVVGSNFPIWFSGEKTSEPGREIFCRYRIHPYKSVFRNIKVNGDGYDIFLLQEKEDVGTMPAKIKKFFNKTSNPPSVISLLDIKDGGAEWLYFRSYDRKYINLIHSVEIQKIENLMESLIT